MTDHVPNPVLVVSGPSGVGKSTTSRLVATTFPSSVHLRADDFTYAIVSGLVQPSLPEAAHQNEVVGAAIAITVMQFAEAGYTVILDGHLFPNGLQGLAEGCALRGIAVHYPVLRTDLATCIARRTSESRAREEGPDAARRPPRPVLRASRPFSDLGGFEANVIEAAGAPDGVAAAVLAAFHSGRLVAMVRAGSPDT